MRHRNAVTVAAAALLALAGCSDRSEPAAASAAGADTLSAPTTAPSPAAQVSRDRPSTKDAPAPKGDCDLLTAAEISAAFDGKLTVRRAGGSGGRGGHCTWSLAEVAESELILQAGDEAAYEARKASYSGNRGIAMEPLAFGKEALLFNKAQVIALREDGHSISLGLQLIAFNAPIPVTEDEARRGLESLAATALERL